MALNTSFFVFYAKTKHAEWTGRISQSQTVNFYVVKNFWTLSISHRVYICVIERAHQTSWIKAFMVEI